MAELQQTRQCERQHKVSSGKGSDEMAICRQIDGRTDASVLGDRRITCLAWPPAALDVLHENRRNSPKVPMVGEDGAESGFVGTILIEHANKTPILNIRLDMQIGKQRDA